MTQMLSTLSKFAHFQTADPNLKLLLRWSIPRFLLDLGNRPLASISPLHASTLLYSLAKLRVVDHTFFSRILRIFTPSSSSSSSLLSSRLSSSLSYQSPSKDLSAFSSSSSLHPHTQEEAEGNGGKNEKRKASQGHGLSIHPVDELPRSSPLAFPVLPACPFDVRACRSVLKSLDAAALVSIVEAIDTLDYWTPRSMHLLYQVKCLLEEDFHDLRASQILTLCLAFRDWHYRDWELTVDMIEGETVCDEEEEEEEGEEGERRTREKRRCLEEEHEEEEEGRKESPKSSSYSREDSVDKEIRLSSSPSFSSPFSSLDQISPCPTTTTTSPSSSLTDLFDSSSFSSSLSPHSFSSSSSSVLSSPHFSFSPRSFRSEKYKNLLHRCFWKEDLVFNSLEALERHQAFALSNWSCMRQMKILIDCLCLDTFFPYLTWMKESPCPLSGVTKLKTNPTQISLPPLSSSSSDSSLSPSASSSSFLLSPSKGLLEKRGVDILNSTRRSLSENLSLIQHVPVVYEALDILPPIYLNREKVLREMKQKKEDEEEQGGGGGEEEEKKRKKMKKKECERVNEKKSEREEKRERRAIESLLYSIERFKIIPRWLWSQFYEICHVDRGTIEVNRNLQDVKGIAGGMGGGDTSDELSVHLEKLHLTMEESHTKGGDDFAPPPPPHSLLTPSSSSCQSLPTIIKPLHLSFLAPSSSKISPCVVASSSPPPPHDPASSSLVSPRSSSSSLSVSSVRRGSAGGREENGAKKLKTTHLSPAATTSSTTSSSSLEEGSYPAVVHAFEHRGVGATMTVDSCGGRRRGGEEEERRRGRSSYQVFIDAFIRGYRVDILVYPPTGSLKKTTSSVEAMPMQQLKNKNTKKKKKKKSKTSHGQATI
ncbi:hypothetical protein CSUI_009567 [Cystoisospora suis]|uniref:Uncharacterized protein n=1 Tax=Cystoisospora suis TaxID=483139 RepID=A0A2C6KGF5_9APIC|nr:hypothetical protein CSUI_009567 [Cystoisospora suis]